MSATIFSNGTSEWASAARDTRPAAPEQRGALAARQLAARVGLGTLEVTAQAPAASARPAGARRDEREIERRRARQGLAPELARQLPEPGVGRSRSSSIWRPIIVPTVGFGPRRAPPRSRARMILAITAFNAVYFALWYAQDAGRGRG